LGASYDLQSGNGAGLFLKEKITKEKVKKKGYDVNKQLINTVLKSTNE